MMIEKVLEAAKKQTQKRVQFAVKAIEGMKERLPDLPLFASSLFAQQCMLFEYYPQFLFSIYNVIK